MAKLDSKTSEEKAHAEYSASGSERWINCPGSHERSKLYPPLPESKYASEGTEAHACLEFLLKNRANLTAAVVAAGKRGYSRDMIEHALEAVRYVEERAAELPGSVIIAETRVDASPFLCDGQFGTLDVSIVQEFGRLVVIDYKYGAGIGVDPRTPDGRLNSQLAYYGLALSYQYEHNFAEIELVIIQPRAFHESGETTRSTVGPISELLEWRDVFRDALARTKMPDAPLASGKWCKFCPASLDCPELKDRSFREAQIVFSDTKGLPAVMPAPEQLPNLGVILNACDRLEDWIAKVRAHAIDTLNRGGTVEGYKLVEKRGTRKWIDEEKAADDALTKFGEDAFTYPELKSPAQIEKDFKADKTVKDWVAGRVTTVVSGVTLATADDKRKAVNGLDKVFGVIEP